MRHKSILVVALLSFCGTLAMAQETPSSLVTAYDGLADTILAVRGAELGLVGAILDGHRRAAVASYGQGDWQGAAAQIALFANEGDNGVGGVRKRLLEGGHHFNAAGEDQGMFEPGYVIVTVEAKKKLLAASAALRQAADDAARGAAWHDFEAVAAELLAMH
jgi:hypothetical protein